MRRSLDPRVAVSLAVIAGMACRPTPAPDPAAASAVPPAISSDRQEGSGAFARARTAIEGAECPDDASPRGDAPPQGRETWCVDTEGRRHGPWTIWFPSGSIAGRVHVGHGTEDGPVKLWWDGDALFEEGQYRDGRPDGTWRTYVEGVLTSESDLRGFPEVTRTWHEEDGTSQREAFRLGAAIQPQRGGAVAVECGYVPPPLPAPGTGGTSTVLVLDTSGSLGDANEVELRRAASLLASELEPEDELSIVTATTLAVIALPLTRVGAADLRTASAAIRSGGGSDLVPALAVAHTELAAAKGRRHVIVFSDAQLPFQCLDAWVRRLRAADTIVSFVAPRDGLVEGVERLATWGGDRATFIADLRELASAVAASHRAFAGEIR